MLSHSLSPLQNWYIDDSDWNLSSQAHGIFHDGPRIMNNDIIIFLMGTTHYSKHYNSDFDRQRNLLHRFYDTQTIAYLPPN